MKRIYSVYDKVARAYHALTVWPHDAPAVRSFSDALLDPKSPWVTHPADYELHLLGTFDEEAFALVCPVIVGEAIVSVVVTGAACVAQAGPRVD